MTATAQRSAAPRVRTVIMTGPSIPAIFADIKVQTRRLVKLPEDAGEVFVDPGGTIFGPGPYLKVYKRDPGDEARMHPRLRCPYGYPGDRLIVLETWRTEERDNDGVDGIRFAADDAFVRIENTREAADRWVVAHDNDKHGTRWRPPYYMPRWASRLTLEIVEIRVERVQDITEADARAEGCTGRDPEPADQGGTIYAWHGRSSAPCPRAHFATLWDQLNGKRRRRELIQLGEVGYPGWRTVLDTTARWGANPWVWVIAFRRLA